jgi:hypothetical protein
MLPTMIAAARTAELDVTVGLLLSVGRCRHEAERRRIPDVDLGRHVSGRI